MVIPIGGKNVNRLRAGETGSEQTPESRCRYANQSDPIRCAKRQAAPRQSARIMKTNSVSLPV